jgi:hypothetical protein
MLGIGDDAYWALGHASLAESEWRLIMMLPAGFGSCSVQEMHSAVRCRGPAQSRQHTPTHCALLVPGDPQFNQQMYNANAATGSMLTQ